MLDRQSVGALLGFFDGHYCEPEMFAPERIFSEPSDPRTQAFLELASVQGEWFSAQLAGRAMGMTQEELIATVDGELWRRFGMVEPGRTAANVAAAQLGQRLQPSDFRFNTLDRLRPPEAEPESAGGGQPDTVALKHAKPGSQASAQLVSVAVSAPRSRPARPAPGRGTHLIRNKPTKPGRKPRP